MRNSENPPLAGLHTRKNRAVSPGLKLHMSFNFRELILHLTLAPCNTQLRRYWVPVHLHCHPHHSQQRAPRMHAAFSSCKHQVPAKDSSLVTSDSQRFAFPCLTTLKDLPSDTTVISERYGTQVEQIRSRKDKVSALTRLD